MQGDITVKAPVAALYLIVLIVSIMVNVYKFAQPSQTVMQGGYSTLPASSGARLPNGEPDPLQHVPRNPQDAVGMPDPTGGRGGQ